MDDEFDVSIYEEEYAEQEAEEEKGLSFFDRKNIPNITNVKAKYNLGEKEVEQIGELKGEIKKASIEIEARLSNINSLKRYYGLLSELWANLSLVCGKLWQDHINDLRKKSWDGIKESEEKGEIPEYLYVYLLTLRRDLYSISQAKNLGFAIEKTNSGFKSFD